MKDLQLQRIIRVFSEARPVLPPDDFTDRVMCRILSSCICPVSPALAMPGKNAGECAYSFFLAGFFYMVFGLSLAVGLRMVDGIHNLPSWLDSQPKVALGISLGFLMLSVLIRKRMPRAMWFARAGILLYIVAVIMNGAVSFGAFDVCAISVALLGLIGVQVAMGLLLASSLRTVNSEG